MKGVLAGKTAQFVAGDIVVEADGALRADKGGTGRAGKRRDQRYRLRVVAVAVIAHLPFAAVDHVAIVAAQQTRRLVALLVKLNG